MERFFLETLRDTINNLGREIIQNSLDAADPEMEFVKVNFKLEKVKEIHRLGIKRYSTKEYVIKNFT